MVFSIHVSKVVLESLTIHVFIKERVTNMESLYAVFILQTLYAFHKTMVQFLEPIYF